MSISVIGAGYVGLVTDTALAIKRYNVIFVDTDEPGVSMINN